MTMSEEQYEFYMYFNIINPNFKVIHIVYDEVLPKF